MANSELIESVGAQFDPSALQHARDLTLKIIEEAATHIQPGWSEDDAKKLIKQLMQENACEKIWHAPQVRFGINTLRAFGEPGEPNVKLQENDVYFLDLGLVFRGHEGDVGRAFTVGNNREMKRVAQDAQALWHTVRDRWFSTGDSGLQLYRFAEEAARNLGWVLTLNEANGHRIADFPHAAKQRGTVEGLDFHPSAMRWILEIQIRHPSLPFGAFFEDLLS